MPAFAPTAYTVHFSTLTPSQGCLEGLEKTKSLVNGQREGGRGRGKEEEGERVGKEGGWGMEGRRKGRRKEGKSKHPGYSHPAYLPSLPNTMTEAESSDPQLVFLSFTDPGTTVRPHKQCPLASTFTALCTQQHSFPISTPLFQMLLPPEVSLFTHLRLHALQGPIQ